MCRVLLLSDATSRTVWTLERSRERMKVVATSTTISEFEGEGAAEVKRRFFKKEKKAGAKDEGTERDSKKAAVHACVC